MNTQAVHALAILVVANYAVCNFSIRLKPRKIIKTFIQKDTEIETKIYNPRALNISSGLK